MKVTYEIGRRTSTRSASRKHEERLLAVRMSNYRRDVARNPCRRSYRRADSSPPPEK
jgi:hypothetical protein